MILLKVNIEIDDKNDLIAKNCIGGFMANGIQEGYLKSVSYESKKVV